MFPTPAGAARTRSFTRRMAAVPAPSTGLDACPISTISRIGVADPTQTGITGTIVTCPKFEAGGTILSPLAGQAVVANMMPGRYGVVATPAADRIAKGEEWLQTNTLDGQKAHDSFLRIGEPSFFQEFGPAGYHVSIGFATPCRLVWRTAITRSACCKTGPKCPKRRTSACTIEPGTWLAPTPPPWAPFIPRVSFPRWCACPARPAVRSAR